MMTPMLETGRLRLREWRLDDFAAFAAFWSDPVMTRFVGGVQNQAQAWRKMAAYAGHWLLRGYGFWVMESRQDNVPVGYCGHWYPADWPEAEIGWAVYPEHQGRGYATEGARAALDHAYGPLGWQTAVSCIREENAASRRVAERLGARLERLFDWDGQSVCLYRYASPNRT